MKKIVFGIILGMFISSGIAVAAELKIVPNPFPVFIDGKKASVEGYNINGSTYLKLRDFEKAGLKIYFDEEKRQIEVTTKETATEAKAPNESKEVNSMDEITKTKYKGYDAIIKDGVTYVIYRIFRDSPYYTLFYDENENVKIVYKNGEKEVERVISNKEYIKHELLIYIPLNIVNELGQ